jgi:serine phosphatase RsbU (regulator of sigma subunit)
MRFPFQPRLAEPAPAAQPVRTEFPTIDGAGMAAAFCGNRVAGDFYDALRVSPQRILFGLLDVAGRRENNRAILISAQKILRTLGTDLFARSDINESEAMTELCHLLNRGIMEAADGVRSCPAFVGCYNEELGTLCYINAGHTPGLLRDGAGVLELSSTGLPLGLFSHATNDAPTVALPKGAVLLLVSRGVVEAEGKNSQVEDLQFGLERVKQRLENSRSHDPQEICDAIVDPVAEHLTHEDRTALAFIRQS